MFVSRVQGHNQHYASVPPFPPPPPHHRCIMLNHTTWKSRGICKVHNVPIRYIKSYQVHALHLHNCIMRIVSIRSIFKPYAPVLRIRIRIHRIHIFLGLLLWIRFRILQSSCKNSKKNLDSYYFVTLFIFEKWCKCSFKKSLAKKLVLKNLVFCWHLEGQWRK
jgi:hypothetical protein